MRMSILNFVIVINLIVAILFNALNALSPIACAIYAAISIGLVIWSVIKTDTNRITYTSALLFYTIATQFGLAIPYLFFGRETLHSYSDYTLRFMNSPYLAKSLILGVIGITGMHIGTKCARKRYSIADVSISEEHNDTYTSYKMYIASIVLLFVVIVFFAYYIINGGMRLVTTYDLFRQSSAYNSSLYSYVLIFFYVGTIYLAASGRIKEHKFGWLLWLILVLFFALNGNKGEFMYALLAVLGMKGLEGQKVTGKTAILIALVLFVLIPGITSLRNIGIIGNLGSAQLDVFDAFGEMGMQIRTSVYVLQDLADGRYSYLWGKSYLQPIFNIVTPFLSHTQATAEIRKIYPGHGFSQVIECYLNFNVIGIVVFYLLIGYLLGKHEIKVKNRPQLAYLGTITCILINATRNYFAFVPGQILIITLMYFIIIKTRVRRTKI